MSTENWPPSRKAGAYHPLPQGSPPTHLPPSSQRRRRTILRSLYGWSKQLTFTPDWFPAWARHPLGGYLGSGVIIGLVLALGELMKWFLPSFDAADEFMHLAVVLIALTW